jgi:ribonuclease E
VAEAVADAQPQQLALSEAPAEALVPPQAAQPIVVAQPVAAPFVLPLTDLQQLAQSAGLSWVHTDADKVAVVQAAIAAEPKPVHVPRERPPLVVLDEGPLILVETKKDLSQVKLPFDQ